MANGEKGKGRSQNQRLKLFYLLDYLLEETDETHTKKVQEIIEHFENYHKIPVEQKTVCSDLHLLDEYGYDYNGFANDYGLYVYLYNPSGRKLLDNTKAKIRISVSSVQYEGEDISLLTSGR